MAKRELSILTTFPDVDILDLLTNIAPAERRQARIRQWLAAVLAQLRAGAAWLEMRADSSLDAWLSAQSGMSGKALTQLIVLGEREEGWQGLTAKLMRVGIALQSGDSAAAVVLAQEVRHEARRRQFRDVCAYALIALTMAAWHADELVLAYDYAQEALQMLESNDNDLCRSLVLLCIVNICRDQAAQLSDRERKSHWFERAFSHAQEAAVVEGAPWRLALCLGTQAYAMLEWLRQCWPNEAGEGNMLCVAQKRILGDTVDDKDHLLHLYLAALACAASRLWPAHFRPLFDRYEALLALLYAERILQHTRIANLIAIYDILDVCLFKTNEKVEELTKFSVLFKKKQEELEAQTRSDPLTGLKNRKHLTEVMQALDAAPSRQYAVLMIDIDHFKSINDRFSHAVGDQALIKVAQVLMSCTAQDDTVVRHGGEEFIIILLDDRTVCAKSLAEKIRTRIERHNLLPLPVTITVSIGVAMHGESTGGAAAVITMADVRLLQAKRRGRNRVVTPEG